MRNKHLLKVRPFFPAKNYIRRPGMALLWQPVAIEGDDDHLARLLELG